MLEMIAKIARNGPATYFTAEEKLHRVTARLQRLGLYDDPLIQRNLLLIGGKDTDAVAAKIVEVRPIAVVLDSVQRFESDEVPGRAGSDAQMHHVVQRVAETTRTLRIPFFGISQVTKDGSARGSNEIPHDFDAHMSVRYYHDDRRDHPWRIAEWHKYRDGDAGVRPILKMTTGGLVEIRVKKKRKRTAPAGDAPFDFRPRSDSLGVNSSRRG
jgi:predicted ATP-dependent serine protease